MPSARTRRLLLPVEQEAIFRSNDADDPRIGDLLTQPDAVPDTAARVAVIVGVPQHIGVERNGGRAGAAAAPLHIRRALTRLATSDIVDVVRSGQLVITDVGDIDTDGKTLEQIHDEQHDVVAHLLQRGYVPIVLGGGHDTAWPTIHALNTVGKPYGVINVDAHADVRPLRDDARAHSGSPFRQMLTASPSSIVEGGFVEFGLQHHAVAMAHRTFVTDHGMHVMMLDDLRRRGFAEAWDQALSWAGAGEALYVSLDMDAFASAFAPGVSAPGADGMMPAELGPCLRRAASLPPFRAFDVVECNPSFDIDGRTAKLAAIMIAEVLAGLSDALRRS